MADADIKTPRGTPKSPRGDQARLDLQVGRPGGSKRCVWAFGPPFFWALPMAPPPLLDLYLASSTLFCVLFWRFRSSASLALELTCSILGPWPQSRYYRRWIRWLKVRCFRIASSSPSPHF